MNSANSIEKKIFRIKKILKKEMDKKHYEKALLYIRLLSNIFYNYNQHYTDSELEEYVSVISTQLFGQSKIGNLNDDVIFFFDGFGMNSRGLIKNYLVALCNTRKKIFYITSEVRKDSIPDLLSLLCENNCEVLFVPNLSDVEKVKFLKSYVDKYKPNNMFMYTYPDDVVLAVLFNHYDKVIKRYQINLTDHAFWLGVDSFDYCIEFRDYGASISKKYRNISEEKIVKLPFYPVISNTEFAGFPFDYDSNRHKLIFSGGSLYKTLGDNNKYYEIVRHILDSYSEAVFWYAGSGDASQMELLINEYPERVFLTPERADFFEIIKRSFFYLSTYPVPGGLMFQYAAAAGKIPVTLKYDEITDDFLLNQKKINIEFTDINELYSEVDKLFKDEKYRNKQQEIVSTSIISPEEFNLEFQNLINNNCTSYEIFFEEIDTTKFRDTYLQNFTMAFLNRLILRTKKISVFIKFPLSISKALICKIFKI